MCGIVGYVGRREAEPLLIDGLRRLEYRGYDSAGLATLTGPVLHVRKRAGRIGALVQHLKERPAPGCVGIGHTRWATHGPATELNAHPHTDSTGRVAVVHNGVIENYAELRQRLEADGIVFRTATDTEVIAQLIGRYLQDDLVEAVQKALGLLHGTYGLAAVSREFPDLVVGARLGSPLIVGLGKGEQFLTSDPQGLAGLTDRAVYLKDHQLCRLTGSSWQLFDQERAPVAPCVEAIRWDTADDGKAGFEHYMLKEIYEQPQALENAMRGRLDEPGATAHFGGLNLDSKKLRIARRFILTGCGTSYHAALLGEYLIEEFARVPVEVEYASEFRYRNSPVDRSTVLVALTQSGETADTLAALRESKRQGQATLALCNVVGSSIAREAQGGVYLHAGPEVGVASTKCFTNQVAVLAMLALYLGRLRHMSAAHGERFLHDLQALPDAVRRALECHGAVRAVAEKYAGMNNCLYLGRHYLFPIALEGALKLKETSYVHAEGYPAAEMKHGPIALIDRDTPSVVLVPSGPIAAKVMSNLEEVRARGGPVIAVACAGNTEAARLADEVVYVPEVPPYLQPLVTVVPLQLLAYEIALLRGCDVDKPRNLAKSVTVE